MASDSYLVQFKEPLRSEAITYALRKDQGVEFTDMVLSGSERFWFEIVELHGQFEIVKIVVIHVSGVMDTDPQKNVHLTCSLNAVRLIHFTDALVVRMEAPSWV